MIYEPETVRILEKVLEKGDSVIIAGAHQGYFVNMCSRLVGDSGRVYGFEPEPKNFEILKRNTISLLNVEIFNHAIGDKNVKAKFYVNSDNDGGHALYDVGLNPLNCKSRETPNILPIEVKMIDDILQVERLKIMILDAEGSEPSIIRGAINTIVDNDVPYIICEINNFALKQCQSSQMTLRAYLSMYGYTGYVMNETEVVGTGKDEVKAFVPDTDQEVVFNMLFSKRGKV